jgi:transposase
MRFVPIKDAEQQSVLLLHRTRKLLVRQRTMLINALRGHLGEFGIVVVQGARSLAKLIAIRADTDDKRGPPLTREALSLLVEQLRTTKSKLGELERDLLAWHRANEVSQRLVMVPEIGPITATAIVATVGDPAHFHSAR